jgi:flagellar hook-basal body complex protein FliE
MVESIDPIRAEMRLNQLLGEDDLFAQAPYGVSPAAAAAPAATAAVSPAAVGESMAFSGNAFEDILSRAIESLNSVSRTEVYANQMVEKYARGEADLQEVMTAQAKMGLTVQMAVTTVNQAVSTLKEITQLQI